MPRRIAVCARERQPLRRLVSSRHLGGRVLADIPDRRLEGIALGAPLRGLMRRATERRRRGTQRMRSPEIGGDALLLPGASRRRALAKSVEFHRFYTPERVVPPDARDGACRSQRTKLLEGALWTLSEPPIAGEDYRVVESARGYWEAARVCGNQSLRHAWVFVPNRRPAVPSPMRT